MILRNKRFQPELPMREQELECVSENAMPQYREGLIDTEAVHAEIQEHPN